MLFEKNKIQEGVFLLVLSIFCFALSVLRVFFSETNSFIFLNWNLFLAFIPWALTSAAVVFPAMQKRWISIFAIFSVWLLFFPNAPYILTDLFHLRGQHSAPIWFDLVLILCFAWTGLLFGFLSLWDLEQILKKRWNKYFVTFLSVALLFVGSYGIYLGRYLRWNSWDLLEEPFQLIYAIGHQVLNPLSHTRAWGMTLAMGIFLNIIYWSFHFIRSRAIYQSVKTQA